MKYLLDTNVLISAFIGHGICSELFEELANQDSIVISNVIVQDLEKNLRKKFAISNETLQEHIWFLETHFLCAKLVSSIEKISRDSNDDHILAFAHQEKIDFIITGDKDLLVLKKYKGIRILQPKEVLKLLME